MNPIVRYIENKEQKKQSTGTNLWAVKPVRKSITLNPWGMYAAGKKEKKNEPRGERPVGCKAGTEVDDGGPAGAGTIKQEKRISRKNGRWAGEPARGR